MAADLDRITEVEADVGRRPGGKVGLIADQLLNGRMEREILTGRNGAKAGLHLLARGARFDQKADAIAFSQTLQAPGLRLLLRLGMLGPQHEGYTAGDSHADGKRLQHTPSEEMDARSGSAGAAFHCCAQLGKVAGIQGIKVQIPKLDPTIRPHDIHGAPIIAIRILAGVLLGYPLLRIAQQPELESQTGREAVVSGYRIRADPDHHHVGPEQAVVLFRESAQLSGASLGEITRIESNHHGLSAVAGELVGGFDGPYSVPAGPGQRKIRRALAHIRSTLKNGLDRSRVALSRRGRYNGQT